jgi:hypothetical protein
MPIATPILSRLVLPLMLLAIAGSAAASSKNGFDLSNSLINPDEILSGGPPKDGIPAIDKPRFLPGSAASFMHPEDRVLGIEMNDSAKAYPIRILNWHEIVNDHIGDNSFAITYCPLCGTGVAFSSAVNGRMLNFGVSGLLYNSDVLLYDRNTDSLWSQIMGQAISGPMAGQRLTPLAISHTTWRAWLAEHPGTSVLSTDTGFRRNYKRDPYAGYEKSRNLYFATSRKAPSTYHPKERVLGLQNGSSYRAYPFIELNKLGKSSFKDMLNGTEYLVRWNAANQSGSIHTADGTMIPTIQSYWFAWFTFHPETEVFKAGQ